MGRYSKGKRLMTKPATSAVVGEGSIIRDGFRLEMRSNDGQPGSLPIETTPQGYRVSVPEGRHVLLIETYKTLKPEPYSTQTHIQVALAAGAHMTHYKLVLEGHHATHHSFLEADVARDASFYSHVFLMGGQSVRNTIQVHLVGENAGCVLNGLYVGRGKQMLETHTLIEHQKPHGTSHEFYKGILDDEAQGVFDGLIVVTKDAQKTDSTQSNKNLLLSPRAKAHSVPELKILANDVKCKHGSTIGQLDAQQLFYLRSRGIPYEEARRLLISAFASEMIEFVQIDELRALLLPCLNLTTSIRK
jgi:Fe-S cluster assembly protein SufD